jgi:hypothetical protein
MTAARTPTGLGAGGRSLWRDVTALHTLNPVQKVQLLEACRSKDRLDHLDQLLRGDVDTWTTLIATTTGDSYELVVNGALDKANATANLLKQLLASLRLPDEVSGKRPQQRGGARGSYKTGSVAPKVSSLDRKRAAATGS